MRIHHPVSTLNNLRNRASGTMVSIYAAALAMLFLCCTASFGQAAQPQQQGAPPAMRPTTYEQQAFESRVQERGGRVDFVFGDDRPFAQCHASTVVEVADGELLTAWFGGTEEKSPDVGIWSSKFSNGAWGPPARIAKVNETAHWNPVLFRDPKKGVFLFFKVGPEIPYWQTYWMKTGDGGATWSTPVELVPGDKGGRGPVKNKPIVLSDGAWLAGASTELNGWKPFVDRSDDGGVTWNRTADWSIDPLILPGEGAIQPTLWESKPGNIHALLRTSGGFIGRADSEDGGKTWTPVQRTDLPNNNSGIDALKLDDGRLFLVYNPIGGNWGLRTPLNLAISKDNGATWQDLVSLESGEGEFSYPAVVCTTKGIAIAYTWKRQRVRCWQIPLEALE